MNVTFKNPEGYREEPPVDDLDWDEEDDLDWDEEDDNYWEGATYG